MAPKVAVIILNWNGWEDTIECLESLYQITYLDYDVIIVDNGSENDSINKIKEYAKGKIKIKSKFFKYNPNNKPIKIIEYTRKEAEGGGKEKEIANLSSNKKLIIIKNEKNYGFAKGNNVGIKYALKTLHADCILLLNNDTVVDKEFLNHCIKSIEKDKVGIVTAKIYYYGKPQRIWAAGGKINMLLGSCRGIWHNKVDAGTLNGEEEVEYAPGTLMLIRRSLFDRIDFLPSCYFGAGEELEFAIKAKRNRYKVICNRNSIIFHKVGMSSNQSLKYLYNSYMTRFLFLERNLPRIFFIIWFPFYKTLIKHRIRTRIKSGEIDSRSLKVLNLAIKDRKDKKYIEEKDLKKVEEIFRSDQY